MDTDFTNDDDVRVILIVHDTKPPFLDGRTVFTKQARPSTRAQRQTRLVILGCARCACAGMTPLVIHSSRECVAAQRHKLALL